MADSNAAPNYPAPSPLPFTVQFIQHGKEINYQEMSDAVVHFAINGYDDVPFSNLWRIACQWPNIASAKGPSPTTITMLEEIKAKGFDWKHGEKMLTTLKLGMNADFQYDYVEVVVPKSVLEKQKEEEKTKMMQMREKVAILNQLHNT